MFFLKKDSKVCLLKMPVQQRPPGRRSLLPVLGDLCPTSCRNDPTEPDRLPPPQCFSVNAHVGSMETSVPGTLLPWSVCELMLHVLTYQWRIEAHKYSSSFPQDELSWDSVPKTLSLLRNQIIRISQSGAWSSPLLAEAPWHSLSLLPITFFLP